MKVLPKMFAVMAVALGVTGVGVLRAQTLSSSILTPRLDPFNPSATLSRDWSVPTPAPGGEGEITRGGSFLPPSDVRPPFFPNPRSPYYPGPR